MTSATKVKQAGSRSGKLFTTKDTKSHEGKHKRIKTFVILRVLRG